MALDLAAAEEVLKEFYLGPVREQLNSDIKFLAQLEKNETSVSGKRAFVPIHVTRNAGVGNIADGGALPVAGEQGYEDSLIPLRYSVGRFQVTGPTIRAARDDRGAFIRPVASEMKGVTTDLKNNLNREVFGTADGVIAQFGVTASGDVLQLAASTTDTQLRQIQRNMRISVGTVASPSTVSASLTVVSVQRAAKTVTVASGTGVVTSGIHFLFRAGSGGAISAQKELTGLRAQIAATGTLFNVNPTTVPEWVSTVNSASANRQLTEDLVQTVQNDVYLESGKFPNLWVGSLGVVKSYANLISAQRRIVNTVDLKAGWTGVEIVPTGTAFASDKDAPENTAFAISTEDMQEYQTGDYGFADYDGHTLRNVSGYDAWEGFIYKDHEIATSQRNAHAIVTQLSQ